MNYSESKVTPLLKEDFTTPFAGSIGFADAVIDVLTFVHHISPFHLLMQKNKREFMKFNQKFFEHCAL